MSKDPRNLYQVRADARRAARRKQERRAREAPQRKFAAEFRQLLMSENKAG